MGSLKDFTKRHVIIIKKNCMDLNILGTKSTLSLNSLFHKLFEALSFHPVLCMEFAQVHGDACSSAHSGKLL